MAYDLEKLTFVAIQAALRAGEILRKGFGTVFQISSKPGQHNLVTEFDHAAEKAIIDLISAHFPDHAFLAEESGASPKNSSNILWVIDPLDGTVNFAHNIPLFAVSIAACIDQQVHVGVIYLPCTNELFIAQKGLGAYVNGFRLHVSNNSQLDLAVGASSLPHRFTHPQLLERFAKMGNPIRELGSAAINLAYLAAGRFDLFWIASLYPWDVAAGKLLVEEAGGKVLHFDGSPHTIFSGSTLLATNSKLDGAILEYLKTP